MTSSGVKKPSPVSMEILPLLPAPPDCGSVRVASCSTAKSAIPPVSAANLYTPSLPFPGSLSKSAMLFSRSRQIEEESVQITSRASPVTVLFPRITFPTTEVRILLVSSETRITPLNPLPVIVLLWMVKIPASTPVVIKATPAPLKFVKILSETVQVPRVLSPANPATITPPVISSISQFVTVPLSCPIPSTALPFVPSILKKSTVFPSAITTGPVNCGRVAP